MENLKWKKTVIIWLCVFIQIFVPSSSTIELCGSYLAEGVGACTQYSTNTTLCCYLRTYSNKYWSSICHSINATDYLGLNGKLKLGDFEYMIDCGDTIGTTCGTIMKPVSYKDCSQFSRSTNSCCFVKYKQDTSCVWLGAGYTGEISYQGLELVCNANYLKIGNLVLILTFLFLLVVVI
jgi:hypothetical protein